MNRQLLILSSLIMLLLLSNFAIAQQVGLMPIPIFTDVKVEAQATFDSTTGFYTYSYTVTNPATNTGEIWTIDIDISQTSPAQVLNTQGLTIPFGLNILTFDEILAIRRNATPIVPVGMKVPHSWDGGLGAAGWANFTSGDPLTKGSDKITPGETQGEFEIISPGIPTIRQIKFTPDWVFLVETEEMVTPEEEQLARQIEDSLPFRTKTLGPTAPPKFLDPKLFLETISSYVNDSVALGWLKDPSLTNNLLLQIDIVRTYLDANDPSKAKTALQAFMDAINQATDSQRTQEAKGLLYFNARYLKKWLPETYIPPVYKLDLTPSDTTLPIGTIHTLTATYMVDNTPIKWPRFCRVTLKVTEGPNAGLVFDELPTGTGPLTFSYTSTKVGTDYLEARMPEVPDYCTEVISPPAKVTWTGGPDLVINLFIPPLIKSEGGKPIFITEITANAGSTDASPSITRYFLSEDDIIDPNQDYPIGERDIPSLAPEEESDGGTQEFVLPDDIPAGTYHLGACADADESVVELNEDNNCIVNQLQLIVALEPPSNQPPDCTSATPSTDTLWPPNHKLVTISISGITDPDGDPVAITITHITQDEPVNGLGDGDTSPDGFGVGTAQAQIRAERSGRGNGRVYAISFTADDGKGGACNGSVKIGVPHDQGKGKTPIDDGQNYDSTQP